MNFIIAICKYTCIWIFQIKIHCIAWGESQNWGSFSPPVHSWPWEVSRAVGRRACSPWRDGWVGESWEKKREPWCYMGRDLGAIGKERLVRLVMLGRPGNRATPGMGGTSGEHTCMETGWLSLCKFMHPLIDIVATSIQNWNISVVMVDVPKPYLSFMSAILPLFVDLWLRSSCI